uniref:Uncharacterized protein n=1 Tax=Ascaris lumbricoides TaxID=6252 RepID=A0A0M3HSR1_ASCLU
MSEDDENEEGPNDHCKSDLHEPCHRRCNESITRQRPATCGSPYGFDSHFITPMAASLQLTLLRKLLNVSGEFTMHFCFLTGVLPQVRRAKKVSNPAKQFCALLCESANGTL